MSKEDCRWQFSKAENHQVNAAEQAIQKIKITSSVDYVQLTRSG